MQILATTGHYDQVPQVQSSGKVGARRRRVMASSCIVLSGLLFLLVIICVASQSADDQQVLELVNDYRTQIVGIPALSTNVAAACVGEQIAHKFVGTPCTNTTGADTPYGQTPDFSDLPTILAACRVSLVNVVKGYIALDCVPGSGSDSASIAAQNITKSQIYQEKLNDTTFTSAGVGSDGIWYALVLATNSSDGNYATTNGGIEQKRLQSPFVLCLLVAIFATFYSAGMW